MDAKQWGYWEESEDCCIWQQFLMDIPLLGMT
jgi:hypothetical protein